jgi:type I restriction enzyme, R subunit
VVTQTNEQALKACIEKALTGTCREQLKLEGLGVAEANVRYRGGTFDDQPVICKPFDM